MADTARTDRVAERVRRILADVISREVRDHNIKMVSITAVKMSTDLSNARIYVSSVLAGADKDQMVESLNHASGFLRSRLSRELKIHRTPNLNFVYDQSIEYGSKMEYLIDQIVAEDKDR